MDAKKRRRMVQGANQKWYFTFMENSSKKFARNASITNA